MKDQLGVVCSSLCVFHCLATPIILGLGVSGALVNIFSTELFHYILIIPVVLIILLTLPISYKRHGIISLVLLGIFGVGLLVTALVFDERYETILTMAGGSLLIFFHIWNLRLQHKS